MDRILVYFLCAVCVLVFMHMVESRNMRRNLGMIQSNMRSNLGTIQSNVRTITPHRSNEFADLDIIRNIPTHPLGGYVDDNSPGVNNVRKPVPLPDASYAVNFFTNTMNTEANGCFMIFNIQNMSIVTVNEYTVFRIVALVLSVKRQQTFLLKAIVYAETSQIHNHQFQLHSLDIMSVVSTSDKWSNDQTFFFDQTTFNENTLKPANHIWGSNEKTPYTFDNTPNWTAEFDQRRSDFLNDAGHFQLHNQLS